MGCHQGQRVSAIIEAKDDKLKNDITKVELLLKPNINRFFVWVIPK